MSKFNFVSGCKNFSFALHKKVKNGLGELVDSAKTYNFINGVFATDDENVADGIRKLGSFGNLVFEVISNKTLPPAKEDAPELPKTEAPKEKDTNEK